MIPRRPASTLFPYTTLFRSVLGLLAALFVGGIVGFALYTVGNSEAAVRAKEFLRSNERLKAEDRKSTRLNSSHSQISYAVFCLKKKKPDHAGDRHGELGLVS